MSDHLYVFVSYSYIKLGQRLNHFLLKAAWHTAFIPRPLKQLFRYYYHSHMNYMIIIYCAVKWHFSSLLSFYSYRSSGTIQTPSVTQSCRVCPLRQNIWLNCHNFSIYHIYSMSVIWFSQFITGSPQIWVKMTTQNILQMVTLSVSESKYRADRHQRGRAGCSYSRKKSK